MRRAIRATCIALATACAGVVSAQPTFTGLGFLPGLTSSRAYGVSADGRYVVGESTTGGSVDFHAFRWSQAGGMESLGVAPGGTVSQAFAVNADGSVVAATSPAPYPPGSFGLARAARWTAATGMVSLGNYQVPAGTYVTQGVTAMSSSGDTIVGAATYSGTQYGFMWTNGTFRTLGIYGSGSYAVARGVSGNGLRAVGDSSTSSGLRAVRWDVTTPTGGISPVSLGILPGGIYSSATAISLDGQTIVGHANTYGVVVPFRWTQAGGMVSLGLPLGATEARASAVNADGSVVVGYTGNFSTTRAFMWTPAGGAVDLNTYLPTLGLDLTGWTLNEATGVSSDGRVIVGKGLFAGVNQAWVATIPTPAPMLTLALAGLVSCRRVRLRSAS